ncbi:hypothetical protein BC567DRAFT_211091 [Phyllosticta citribraziliensis]
MPWCTKPISDPTLFVIFGPPAVPRHRPNSKGPRPMEHPTLSLGPVSTQVPSWHIFSTIEFPITLSIFLVLITFLLFFLLFFLQHFLFFFPRDFSLVLRTSYPRTVGSWRSGGPLQPTDKKTSWAKKGAIGHLPTYSADDHKDSCLAKKIEGETFKVEGFFSHPVLILSDPDDKGRVKIFPLTTWGGKSIEEKWKDMEDSKKAKKFSHFCQIEHPGVEATLPELSLMDGGRIQRRSYVNMETCWEVEESILNKYRGNKGDSVLFVTPRSFKIVENYANSKQML